MCQCSDSPAFLSFMKDGKRTIEEFTTSHKPTQPIEKKRIETLGSESGIKVVRGRIGPNGLNISRSFGDYSYKRHRDHPFNQQYIISEPDIKHVELDRLEHAFQFVVGASDGLYEDFSIEDVNAFILERLKEQKENTYYKNHMIRMKQTILKMYEDTDLRDMLKSMFKVQAFVRQSSILGGYYKYDLKSIVEELIYETWCKGSADNITVTLILFKS